MEFWDVDLLDVNTGIITRVKTPTGNGIQVGNPSFGETNDRYIVCDIFSYSIKYNAIATFDSYTLREVEVDTSGFLDTFNGPFPNVGIPRYAPDDRSVVFQRYNQNTDTYTIYRIQLGTDKMSPSGAAASFHSGEFPVWFVRGGTTGSEESAEETPVAFRLGRNYPNPFNPVTVIPFALLESGRVTLTVYDALGRKVTVLADGERPAGEYTARFDGALCSSGMYFYRLRVGNAEETGKMTLVR